MSAAAKFTSVVRRVAGVFLSACKDAPRSYFEPVLAVGRVVKAQSTPRQTAAPEQRMRHTGVGGV
jgi:hypothetical protein